MLVGSIVAIVLGVQVWAANNLLSRTEELRTILSNNRIIANQLERRIGYGGLIHNFKNYVLRPDEDKYRIAAQEDARRALTLIEKLQVSASQFDLDVPLVRSREMIISYAERLENVRKFTATGRSAAYVDERVRFDDQPALLEVESLLTDLDQAVEARLGQLQRGATVAAILIYACSLFLGLMYLSCFAYRQRMHFISISKLADKLSCTNKSLSRANSTLNQFAGIVSHDLKVPVNHLRFFGMQLAEGPHDSPVAEENIARINRCVENMDKIIDSLLDFSRTGFSQPRMETVYLSDLLRDVEQCLQSELQNCNAKLIIDVTVDQSVKADYALLGRVFANLITNSIKYRTEDLVPKVEIRGTQLDETIEFSVSDNGIGIDPKYADRIFEPLQRLHGTQDEYEGSGIGLTLAKSIIEGHMGQIRLDTQFTSGTRIVFTLPNTAATTFVKAA